MQPKKFTGKLIAIDMYNCGVNEVNDTEKAKTLLQEGCDKYQMNRRKAKANIPSPHSASKAM